MSKYIKPLRPLLFCSAQSSTFTARMPPGHMSTAQPSELACLPQEPQSHNEAQDLLLLQDYVCKLTHTLRTLEDTHALVQQNRTPCRRHQRARLQSHTHSLLLHKESAHPCRGRANVTEREVISRQLQLMQASVQHYPTEDLNTADTSCLSRTSAEHFDDRPGPCSEENARIPCINVTKPATIVNRPHQMQLAATPAR